MPVHILVVALLAGTLAEAPAGGPPRAPLLAQADRVDEGFGDAPPALEEGDIDAAEPIPDAPALPAPTVDDTAGTPAAPSEETPKEQDTDEPGEPSPLLTRSLQYGAGLGTLAACTGAGCVGLFCASPLLAVAFQFAAFTMPWLLPCVYAASLTGIGAAAGAASGAVEGLVGDTFGEEDGGVLWPTLAAAGTGAGLMGLYGAAMVGSQATSRAFNPDPLTLQFDNPLSCLFASAAVVLCGAFCVATPLAGVLAYGAVATPAEADAAQAVHAAPPAPARLAGGPRSMAY